MSGYAPGTVAVATVRGVEGVRVMAGEGTHEPKLRWFTTDNRVYAAGSPDDEGWYFDFQVTDVKPLVVLDLEDSAEAVRGLRYVADAARHMCEWDVVDAIADQIEAQTKPPKPAEPTGLGAVVVDTKGRRWVRDSTSSNVVAPWRMDTGEPIASETYADIDVVDVLSEGVTS